MVGSGPVMGERIPDFGVRQQDLAAFAVVFACLHACLRQRLAAKGSGGSLSRHLAGWLAKIIQESLSPFPRGFRIV
jgi:hypothetical protein